MIEEDIKQKAEEYTNKNDTIVMGFEENLDCTDQMQQAFIDGYHECQKEHEWHYVKNEGTPTKEGHYLVCLRNKDHDIFDCWIFVSDNVPYSLKVRMIDIYAWKEIVLPELKESE